ncbi:hypothetical protein [Holdemania massiliensis]|uniref:Uncharacterized protein n=1 Tax=Holdemania massiliensis TaxID=1468449 RepID=A0A6N7SBN3_9FIRM|nr:hypothetical protein [Holdemania massiliensis]MSA73141.1 hypothetical protein [Holdemania massiliensis]MSA91314.1 hypothetical protein [Holdemania massiliensis]MSB80170.1 hypothetical protein [Holdemania massiliensis]MSC35091.1 hypothetical protein [Holdemania massiliensis]MSC41480.1 hypothetical protein [Holdemania massiliensis]
MKKLGKHLEITQKWTVIKAQGCLQQRHRHSQLLNRTTPVIYGRERRLFFFGLHLEFLPVESLQNNGATDPFK